MFSIINLKEQSQHIDTIAQWHHQQWSHFNPQESIAQRIHRMQAYLDNNFVPTTFLAIDGALLGSAAIVDNDMETRPELSPWLASVYVVAHHRNNGVGGKLVNHVVGQAKSKGINKLYLMTPDRKNFYQALGWKKIDEERYHGFNVTIMEISLNDG